MTRAAPTSHAAGMMLALAALLCFAGLDSCTKAIGLLPVAAVMWCRFSVQSVLMVATQLRRRGRALFATGRPGLQALRGALLLGSSMTTYLGLRVAPIGEFTAIVLLTPLVLTVVSAFAYGEAVSRLRWALLGTAFCGALLIVHPAEGIRGRAMAWPLLALALNTAFHLVTSRLARTESPATMHLYTGLVGMALATLALPFVSMPPTTTATWMLLGLICVLSTAGHALLILAYSKTGIARLTPLLFAQIAFATLLGWLVFSHVPDAWAALGICVIMASGAACMRMPPRSLSLPAPRGGRPHRDWQSQIPRSLGFSGGRSSGSAVGMGAPRSLALRSTAAEPDSAIASKHSR